MEIFQMPGVLFFFFQECWTEFFDVDDPTGLGDNEALYILRKKVGRKLCRDVLQIDARNLDGVPAALTGDNIFR